MLFRVPADVFRRAALVTYDPALDPADARAVTRGVHVERADDMVQRVVASNGRILTVENLGYNFDGAPGNVTVAASLAGFLLADSILTVDTGSGTAWQEVNGVPMEFFDYAANVIAVEYPKWRTFVPKPMADGLPERSKHPGHFGFFGHVAARLASASPTGRLTLPEFINDDPTPIIVRALNSEGNALVPNWVGMFLRETQDKTRRLAVSAVIPDWLHS